MKTSTSLRSRYYSIISIAHQSAPHSSNSVSIFKVKTIFKREDEKMQYLLFNDSFKKVHKSRTIIGWLTKWMVKLSTSCQSIPVRGSRVAAFNWTPFDQRFLCTAYVRDRWLVQTGNTQDLVSFYLKKKHILICTVHLPLPCPCHFTPELRLLLIQFHQSIYVCVMDMWRTNKEQETLGI